MRLLQRCCEICWKKRRTVTPLGCTNVLAVRSDAMTCDFCFDGCYFDTERDSVIHLGLCDECEKLELKIVR